MEHIVGVKVIDEKNKKHFFLTWGRIFDPIDSGKLLDVVKNNLSRFNISEIKEMKLCEDLQEAARERFFFETFFIMCQREIPFGKKHNLWRSKMKKLLLKGKEIYFLG